VDAVVVSGSELRGERDESVPLAPAVPSVAGLASEGRRHCVEVGDGAPVVRDLSLRPGEGAAKGSLCAEQVPQALQDAWDLGCRRCDGP
jgi:hypothetical protein